MMSLENKVKIFDNELAYISLMFARLHFMLVTPSSSETTFQQLSYCWLFLYLREPLVLSRLLVLKYVLVNLCKVAEYLLWGPCLILHAHCWWCTSPPSQVKLIIKWWFSPCLVFCCLFVGLGFVWFSFVLISDTSLLSCLWKLKVNWRNTEISLCSATQRTALLVNTLLGGPWPSWVPACNTEKKGFGICISARVTL